MDRYNEESIVNVKNYNYNSIFILILVITLPVFIKVYEGTSIPVSIGGENNIAKNNSLFKSSYTPHEPILIIGNDELDAFCSGNGTDGTENNPHNISGFEINASTSRYGIEIRDVDKHVVIENNSISNILSYAMSELYPTGINVINSTNIELNNNNLEKSYIGAGVYNSSDISIIGNHISWNAYMGLIINNTINNIVKNNYFLNCGVYLSGTIDECRNQEIDNSNTMNYHGKLYYYKDVSSTLPNEWGDGSQLIMVNCSNIKIENKDFHSTSIGLISLYSTNISVVRNRFFNLSYFGALFVSTNASFFHKNLLRDSIYSCVFAYSHNNSISFNNFSYNMYDGLVLGYCSNTMVYRNIASFNPSFAMKIHTSSSIMVMDNHVFNSGTGIGFAWDCSISQIKGNSLYNNTYAGIETSFSTNITCTQNTMEENGIGIKVKESVNGSYFLNNFIGNIDQTMELINGNAWNNSAWGNYWSDYEILYPNASIIDNNTWDMAYEILNGYSFDYYPLVNETIAPRANFTINATYGIKNQDILFNFTGILGDAPVDYNWTFDDGEGSQDLYDNIHSFQNTGIYNVSFWLEDLHQEKDVFSILVIVEEDRFPVASLITSSQGYYLGSIVSFDASSSKFGNEPYTLTWYLDGKVINTEMDILTIKFNSTGKKILKLIIEDYNQDIAILIKEIEVKNPAIIIFIIGTILSVSIISAGILVKKLKARRNKKIERELKDTKNELIFDV